ncbi:hypothetical protein FPOA_01471 [Fusarium poae]|uniref:Uncharacterized protein n=2 Tax=Fusarium poae TaxID=36050 RepID=A0A1B8B493_FUSPO|nr:hypothetical protein FPOA_01471 [Fusarium poae]
MKRYVYDASRCSVFQDESDDDNERATAYYSTDAARHHESSVRQPTDSLGLGSDNYAEEEEDLGLEAALKSHLGTEAEAESETKPGPTFDNFNVASIAKKMESIGLEVKKESKI